MVPSRLPGVESTAHAKARLQAVRIPGYGRRRAGLGLAEPAFLYMALTSGGALPGVSQVHCWKPLRGGPSIA